MELIIINTIYNLQSVLKLSGEKSNAKEKKKSVSDGEFLRRQD